MKNYKQQKNSVDWRNTLSKKDKAAYIIIGILLGLLAIFSLLSYLSIKSVIAFWDENVLALASGTSDTWYIAPFCFFILDVIIYIDINYRRNGVHIFNKKDDRVKCHISKKEHVVKKEKADKLKKILIAFSLTVICIVISLFGLFSRTVMTQDGNVHSYNFLNKEKSIITIDDIKSLSVNATVMRLKKPDETDLFITVYCNNSRPCVFNVDSFIGSDNYNSYADGIKGLIKIKELLHGKPVTVNGTENLEEVAEFFEIPQDKMHLLYELFEIE